MVPPPLGEEDAPAVPDAVALADPVAVGEPEAVAVGEPEWLGRPVGVYGVYWPLSVGV